MNPIYLFLLLITFSPLLIATPPALTPHSEAVITEARSIVDSMKRNERGPYSRIRWFCNDGSSHPPKPYPCGERGGGRQHAEYSTERNTLTQLGWHVGTVVAALTWEELWQPEKRHQRMRELPVERYLETVDDGWVLRRAQHYRGRVQLEDEEKSGRALLLKLMEQPGFLNENFLLARELARTLPHGTSGSDRTRTIRHLAQEIADVDTAFSPLRIEIHSLPSARTSERVRDWFGHRKTTVSADIRDKIERLASGLDDLYGSAGRRQRLQLAADALAKLSPTATRLIMESQGATPALHIERLSQAMVQLRKDTHEKEPAASLRRLDLLTDLEAELRTSALERLEGKLTRRELYSLARNLLDAAWGLGLLSSGEHEALSTPIKTMLSAEKVPASDYALTSRRLSLAAPWATQTVQHTFAEPLSRYALLDNKTTRFTEDLLRDSILLPLGEISHRVAIDGARAIGINHQIFGEPTGNLLGINPGIASGRLRIMEHEELARGVQAAENEIVVLTETVADLNPVAGIMTMGEGNPLSHVQMLARNLGIPNLAFPADLLPKLRSHAGQEVFLAVSGDGRVLLEKVKSLSDKLPSTKPSDMTPASKVSAPQPDLHQLQPLPLIKLHAGLSGKVVGPKAANVGQLNHLFEERITPAIAIPFGIFAKSTVVARERLHKAFVRHRAGELDLAGLNTELDAIRQMVAKLTLQPELVNQLSAMMQKEFGPNGSYGLFVRSDTNAEDLPEFTGAGLNQTIPNVVGLERQLAAVIQVWSSVYSQRAMAWRSRILSNPHEVFASVLLMKSVPSEKSGVLVTTDLATGNPGLTVSAAWGVGGAVDNESAASRVLRPDGTSLLLAEAKAPYQRSLNPEGGIIWLPAASGPVLNASELKDLRQLADDVLDRYPPVLDKQDNRLPWDIEFAFAKGKLWLLQIRPLIQRGQGEADALLNKRLPIARTAAHVSLDEPPFTATGAET